MDNFQNNFMNALQGGYQFGQQLKQQEDKSNFSRLAGQAYGAAPAQRQEIIGQAMGINPQAASALNKTLQSDEETRNKTIANAARLLTTAPEQYRPQLYQNIRGDLARYIPGMPEQYDQTVAEAAQSIADAYGDLDSSTPAGLREFQGLTQGLPQEDVLRARRVKLGLDGRASSAGFSQVKFTDAQGRERVGVMNGKTGQIDLPDGTSFNPQTGAISQTQGVPTQANMEADIALANELIASGIPEAQVDAFLASRGQRAQAAAPMVQAGGDAFTGRRKEDEVAATKQAEIDVQLRNAGQMARADAEAAALKEEATRAAEARVELTQLLPKVESESRRTVALIDRALNHPGREVATGASSKLDPRNFVPGTDATNFRVLLEQLRGGTFLQAFQSLKGGGAITQVEGQKAEQAIARLDQAQSDEEFIVALKDLREVAASLPASIQAKLAAAGQQQAGTSQGPQPGTVQDGYRFKGGNPADPNSWERL